MYDITIDNFNGPMDLLLHLIKESKMSIFDIKLEVIINEYLEYIEKQKELNLNIASSYLVMASELIEIKSRMLLPKEHLDEEEEEDPKERLINRLIEYQKYKDQIENFKKLEYERNMYYTKLPEDINEYKTDEKKVMIDNITLDDLVIAFSKFLERSNMDKPLNTKITQKEYSVENSIKDIKKKLVKGKKISFFSLFTVKSKSYMIVTFLAILEMAKNGDMLISQENDEILCEAI